MSDLKHIDEPRLESDLGYRVGYVTEFMGFTGEDIALIHGAAPHLAPLVSSLVDAVYVQLFKFDATKRHFVPRQHGYEGTTPENLDQLKLDHEQIKFRKQHLSRYLVRLVTEPFDARMLTYLDMVGKIHTDQAGSANIHVPLVQMNALMGFVADAITATIYGLNLDRESERKTVRAFQKLLWVQNDLIVRHYARA